MGGSIWFPLLAFVTTAPHGRTLSAPTFGWATQLTGSNNIHTDGLAPDGAGGAIVAGHFKGTATFGSTTLTSSGLFDGYVARLDSSGSVSWAVRYGGASAVSTYSAAADGSGGAWVVGSFEGSATFGSSTLTSAGGADMFVFSVDSSGSIGWAVSASGSDAVVPRSVAADGTGGLLVVGRFKVSATFGSTTLTSSGNSDLYVARLTSLGAFSWAVNAGSSSDLVRGYAVAPDGSGGALVTGSFMGTATFGSTTLTASGTNEDVYVLRIDSSGSVSWAIRMGSSLRDRGRGIAADDAGGAFVTGYFKDTGNCSPRPHA